MDINSYEFQEKIYDLANGFLSLDSSIPESEFVNDEFAESSFCSQAYENVLAAYGRLCRRLDPGCEEDRDVEVIIDQMNAIAKHMAIQMFRYGVFFAQREK